MMSLLNWNLPHAEQVSTLKSKYVFHIFISVNIKGKHVKEWTNMLHLTYVLVNTISISHQHMAQEYATSQSDVIREFFFSLHFD